MLTRPPTLSALALLPFGLAAQCPAGNVTISSQGDASLFAASYPSCDTLPGDLTISGLNITDLSCFNGVQAIMGDVTVTGTYPGPYDFTGFEQVAFIGGDLEVNTPRFRDFTGLDNLQRVGGDIYIHNCDSLQSLSGLWGLDVVEGDLTVLENFFMQGYYGLNELDSVYGSVSINTPHSPALTFITIPDQLDFVGGDFHMSAQYATVLTGGAQLKQVGGTFNITGPALASVSGLGMLTRVSGTLQVNDADDLLSLGGFAALDSVGGLRVNDNPVLATISGFADLDVVEGYFWIGSGNTALTSIYGFAELDTIGTCVITLNPVLNSIIAFDQTIGIGGLQIDYNPQLSYCHVQAVCDRILAPIVPIAAIFDNAAGCMTEPEVEGQCISTSIDDTDDASLSACLDVTAGTLMLCPMPVGNVFIKLLDPTGRLIREGSIAGGVVPIHGLGTGTYILRCSIAGQAFTLPFVLD